MKSHEEAARSLSPNSSPLSGGAAHSTRDLKGKTNLVTDFHRFLACLGSRLIAATVIWAKASISATMTAVRNAFTAPPPCQLHHPTVGREGRYCLRISCSHVAGGGQRLGVRDVRGEHHDRRPVGLPKAYHGWHGRKIVLESYLVNGKHKARRLGRWVLARATYARSKRAVKCRRTGGS